jgi:hypothetical protein
MKQEQRQWFWSVVFYGGFAVAIILAWLRINGTLGQEWGATVLLAEGFAIAAAVRLSRMRLTETMLQVYRAGVESARAQHEERLDMEKRIRDAAREG